MSISQTIRSQAMMGTSHSWAVTIRSLLLEFAKMGNSLDIHSINGWNFFPKELEKFVENNLKKHDIDITYTLPRNFKDRFLPSSKLKLAIYNYETSQLPPAWKDQINYIDYALPSSNFSKEVFVNSGWPENKCIVIPHGINPDDFKNKSLVTNIKSNKSFKFLNVSIPHYRKNLSKLVDAYYSAFSSHDDVVLIIKTSLKKPKYIFECDAMKEILSVQKMKKYQHKSLPQIEILQHKYDNIIPLYNSCDCLVSATSSEGFGLPLLEGLAAGMVVIAPRCTGQMDFLSDKNSLLVSAREIDAPPNYQYWRPTPGAKTFEPDIQDLSQQMKNAYENKQSILSDFSESIDHTISKFTWEAAAKMIMDI